MVWRGGGPRPRQHGNWDRVGWGKVPAAMDRWMGVCRPTVSCTNPNLVFSRSTHHPFNSLLLRGHMARVEWSFAVMVVVMVASRRSFASRRFTVI